MKSPSTYPTVGSTQWNVSWNGRNLQEYPSFAIRTYNYTSESHLEFGIIVYQQTAFPWTEPRSSRVNQTYNYSLNVTNIGDVSSGIWNISLAVPPACNITNATGTINTTNNTINWTIPDTAVREFCLVQLHS